MVFEALISQKSDGTYMPKLASDYSVSDDGMSYTFTIRDGVTWHDGQPFTAEDVVWSLSAGVADPNATQIASRLVGIEGADAVKDGTADTLSGVTADGNQVTVKLSYPNNGFLDSMSMFFILPNTCWAMLRRSICKATQSIGPSRSGPEHIRSTKSVFLIISPLLRTMTTGGQNPGS
jgi:ABC-type transport system substrate-binding protein